VESIDLSQLSQDQLKRIAARAIHLIQNPEAGIGTELFEALLKIVPQACVEAVVVDNLDDPVKIYLTWREDQHYQGWHCPGTYIRLGESFEEAIRRVLRREIDAGLRGFRATNIQYSRVDSRGHTVGTVWLVQADDKPSGGEWFSIKEPPDPTLPHHVEILERVFGKKS